MTLTLAAAHASLACRELRDLASRPTPEDPRAPRPSGEALAQSEWQLNLAINSIPALVWSTTPDGMLDFSNQHLLDFVGLTFEDIRGLGYCQIYHPDDLPVLLDAWQDIMSQRRGREVEGRIRRHDGVYEWFALRQKPLLDAQGNVVKWYGAFINIDDRKRAEDALLEAKRALVASEANLELLINSLPVLVWSARPDGSADYVNQRWLDYAGLPPDRILEWDFLKIYHPDDVPRMMKVWQHDLAHAQEHHNTGRILGADGQYRWFYFRGRKLTDAHGVTRWFGANIDIEDLRRAEDALKAGETALRESERRLQQIVSSIPGLAWSSDRSGATTFWSRQYLDYTGLTSEEVLGWGFLDHIHPEDREHLLDVWANALKTGAPGEAEGRLRRADGQYRWFLIRASPFFDGAGNLTQWFGVNIDIENRKRTEEDLQRSRAELAHVTRMMTMGELAVSIAHEVNQPLMAIVTNASACLRWLSDDRLDLALARDAVARIVEDGHRAGAFVSSIRAMARKSAPRMDPVDLQEVILGVLDILRGELTRRGVSWKTEFSPDMRAVRGDGTQLQQVILNLIMNGVEAMADVDKALRHLTIRTGMTQGCALVSVADSGTGLGPDSPDRLFEAFFTTKPEGIGMGLSICRSIVEAHGGRIWARNTPPRGSVFSFTLAPLEGGCADAPAR
ncbi:PAS domain S-box protein (plasmid) [Paroceanicella profunda]|uniref:histidine kinase n=2 Tax=Paroceanicella profunda TaxID=2579971 RepID=A0A5B8G5D5_9RHOB|nr:PAS domain S-box protein [Paroceanicella profunda]